MSCHSRAGLRVLLLAVLILVGFLPRPTLADAAGDAAFAETVKLNGFVQTLQTQVQTLQTQVALQQAAIDSLIAKLAEQDTEEEGEPVTAPFNVIGKDGRSLLYVDSDDLGALVIIGRGSGNEISLAAGDEGSISIGVPAQARLNITANNEEAKLVLGTEDGPSVRLLQKESGAEVVVATDENKRARLTQSTDGAELYMLDSGHVASFEMRSEGASLMMGQASGRQVMLKETTDGGSLTIGPAGSPSLALLATPDGGSLTLGKSGGKNAKLSQDGGGTTLALGATGKPDVKLSAVADGGEMIFGATQAKVKLSSNDTGGTLVLGDPAGVRVRLGTPPGGNAIVEVANSDNRTELNADDQFTGLQAVTALGVVQVGKYEEDWGLLLRKGNALDALVGKQGGKGTAVMLFGDGGDQPSVRLLGEGQGGKLQLGTGDDPAIELESSGDSNHLYMGKKGTRHIELLAESDEASVSTYDGDDFARIYINATEVAVMARNTEMSSELGKVNGNWGLNLFEKGGPMVAGLSDLDGRGMALRMYEDNKQVGAFGPAPDGSGGTLRLYSGGDGATVALGAEGSGEGYVNVFDSGGTNVLGMVAIEPAFAVYSSSGVPVAALGYSSSGDGGNITTTDSSGMGVFSAGAASDGGGEVCVIRENNKGACLGIGLPGMGTGQ